MKKNKISVFDIKDLNKIDKKILNKYPILKYRLGNIANNIDVRGLKDNDYNRCPLMLDDSVIGGDFHYQCVIHMREGGKPIGRVGPNMRQERHEHFLKHDTHQDPICKGVCLDVCRDYNNKYRDYHENR